MQACGEAKPTRKQIIVMNNAVHVIRFISMHACYKLCKSYKATIYDIECMHSIEGFVNIMHV